VFVLNCRTEQRDLRFREILFTLHTLNISFSLGSGLQLYLAKDGTVTFDKSSNRDQELKPVVMTDLTR
jgi:hypothetical protein